MVGKEPYPRVLRRSGIIYPHRRGYSSSFMIRGSVCETKLSKSRYGGSYEPRRVSDPWAPKVKRNRDNIILPRYPPSRLEVTKTCSDKNISRTTAGLSRSQKKLT